MLLHILGHEFFTPIKIDLKLRRWSNLPRWLRSNWKPGLSGSKIQAPSLCQIASHQHHTSPSWRDGVNIYVKDWKRDNPACYYSELQEQVKAFFTGKRTKELDRHLWAWDAGGEKEPLMPHAFPQIVSRGSLRYFWLPGWQLHSYANCQSCHSHCRYTSYLPW